MYEELMRNFQTKTMVEIISQMKTNKGFIFNKFFTKKGGVNGNIVKVPIQKGEGIILHSVSPYADHIIHDKGNVYMVDLTLPRFPLESVILAAELNELEIYSSHAEKLKSLAQLIGKYAGEHKNSFVTTLEYMAAGALFGKVMDGDGKILFEFESERDVVEFKSDQDPITALRAIDTIVSDEFGSDISYTGLASNEFMDKLWARCVELKLDEKKQAAWVEKDNKRCLEVHGTTIYPYSATYKNEKGASKRFIPEGNAVFIPNEDSIFNVYYGRADHSEALRNAPTEFFSTLEPLAKGKGYSVLSETKQIPVCLRPSAVILASWVNV